MAVRMPEEIHPTACVLRAFGMANRGAGPRFDVQNVSGNPGKAQGTTKTNSC
ncbi:Hypothetical protein CINCED_3A006691, partial [Cinara cedri]